MSVQMSMISRQEEMEKTIEELQNQIELLRKNRESYLSKLTKKIKHIFSELNLKLILWFPDLYVPDLYVPVLFVLFAITFFYWLYCLFGFFFTRIFFLP